MLVGVVTGLFTRGHHIFFKLWFPDSHWAGGYLSGSRGMKCVKLVCRVVDWLQGKEKRKSHSGGRYAKPVLSLSLLGVCSQAYRVFRSSATGERVISILVAFLQTRLLALNSN